MFSLRKPTTEQIQSALTQWADAPFTYEAVGATRTTPPAGFTVDRYRIELGCGESVYLEAIAALRSWQMLKLGWVEATPSSEEPAVGATIAMLAHTLGIWALNLNRIVYVDEQSAPSRRFSFAWGTLLQHAECGEERFSIDWNPVDDVVGYEIEAFSRPRHPLARLGYFHTRRLQRRFARDSQAAMKRAVGIS